MLSRDDERDDPRGEAPKKCSTFLGGFSYKIIITLTPPNVTPEFSSDLERAPGARSIADENSGVTFGVVELRRCEPYEHFCSHPVLLGTLYPARAMGYSFIVAATRARLERAAIV